MLAKAFVSEEPESHIANKSVQSDKLYLEKDSKVLDRDEQKAKLRNGKQKLKFVQNYFSFTFFRFSN